MQIIPKKWYSVYNWILVAVSTLFIITFTLTKTINSLAPYSGKLNLTLNGSIFALLTIIAGSIGYIIISKRNSAWLASLLTTMAFDLFIVTQLANTSHTYMFVYIAIWWALAIYTGAFGLIVVLAINLITLIIGILESKTTLLSVQTNFKIMIVGTILFSIVPYLLFWRLLIAKQKPSNKVTNLEGLPDDTRKQNETLIESIGDGVFVTDKSGKIILFNPAASIMTEWDSKDAIGLDVNLVFKVAGENGQEIPETENPFKTVLLTNRKVETIVLLTGHKGKKIILSLVISTVLTNEQPVGIVGVMRDITAQRAAEKQRADFISTASHEMRTPVAAIEGYLSLAMNSHVANIDTKARDYLEKAHQSTQQLGKLFQDLLTSSKAEDGRLVNHPVVVEMSQFIQQLAESFQLAAQKKSLIVDFAIVNENGQSDQPSGKVIAPLYYVHVDPDRLSEVITNIYDNAVKYTLTGKITVGLGGDNANVQVFIQDTGAGIPAEDIPHLFQKFYRVDNSAVRTIGGTGLGLYICKKIVELYGGQIWAESELGKGSIFRISLPRLNTQQADALKRTEALQEQIAMPSSNATS
jgi:PAS domain S-box-containing protein